MHSLILGMTESGKTTCAKMLITEFKSRGIHTIVLDPLRDPAFGADFQTADPAEFERVWKASRSCQCFIDETGAVGKFSECIRTAATRGRHWGHSFYFLAQKATQIEPIVRDQCGALFLFASGSQSGKILAEEFNAPILADCTALQKGEYFYSTRFGAVQRRKLF